MFTRSLFANYCYFWLWCIQQDHGTWQPVNLSNPLKLAKVVYFWTDGPMCKVVTLQCAETPGMTAFNTCIQLLEYSPFVFSNNDLSIDRQHKIRCASWPHCSAVPRHLEWQQSAASWPDLGMETWARINFNSNSSRTKECFALKHQIAWGRRSCIIIMGPFGPIFWILNRKAN